MANNEQKCKCQISITNEKTINPKSSKTVQTLSPADSDVYYDIPDEEDSAIPNSSNRSRTTTQNDRNRDHTNLSHEPNIEAPAGPTQQPSAGQRQTYQAKDKMNSENDNGNKKNKENFSQNEKFGYLSSEAGNSIVKLSFSTANAYEDLQGSYECFCDENEEAEEKGSCHKFWCQCYEDLENTKKIIIEDSVRVYESQKKSNERRKIDNETRIVDPAACCSQEMISDLNRKPAYECCKNLINSSYTESCENEEIESQEVKRFLRIGPISNEREDITRPSSNDRNSFKHGIGEHKSSTKLSTNPKNVSSNVNEFLLSCEELENFPRKTTASTGRLHSKESNIPRRSNMDQPFCSVGTGITPRQQTIDDNVIPLLKGIFDVLQTMREEKLHLGPIASRNVDIHLDEPFVGFSPPQPSVTPSSPKSFSFDSQRSSKIKSTRNNLEFVEEPDVDFINSQDNLAFFEPPERDLEESYQEISTTSQRLIPVDMDLLRTDEELIWEPGYNDEESIRLLLKDQFQEEKRFQSKSEELNISNSDNTEPTPPLSSLKRSSSMEATDSCKIICAEDRSIKSLNINSNSDDQTNPKASLQKLNFDGNEQTLLKIQASQAVQVNLLELENLTSPSTKFSALDSQLDLSNEELLEASEINKSSKFDVGTDCPDFDNNLGNDDRSSTKSFHYSHEPIQPSQNQEMSQFIESILFDLKAMDSFRKNSSQWQNFARLPPSSPTGGWQRPSRDLSYPVTIETVQELGANSLFIKWRVQSFGNIGGYEIFLDGRLTNRYFNCIHRAAVICNVDLHCSHRITLRAQPLLQFGTPLLTTDSCCSTSNTKRPSNTASTTHPEASCPQPDGTVWYPSVYHFEPNSLSAPINAVLY